MTIRRIKERERANGMKYCTFCKPTRVDAVWRDSRLSFSCDEHKERLYKDDVEDYYTEADYQTWMKV